MVRTSTRLEEEINERVFTSAFQAILRKAGGDPRQAIGDLTNVRQFLTGTGLQAFFDAPWAPIYLAFSFFLHPWLGWFTVGDRDSCWVASNRSGVHEDARWLINEQYS